MSKTSGTPGTIERAAMANRQNYLKIENYDLQPHKTKIGYQLEVVIDLQPYKTKVGYQLTVVTKPQ